MRTIEALSGTRFLALVLIAAVLTGASAATGQRQPAAAAAWTHKEAAAAANRSEATDSVKYETSAVKAFWGDATFMRDCAPRHSSVAAPFDIYVEILPNGHIGRSLFVPETKAAKCVRDHTAGRRFPARANTFVLHIAMSFKA